VASAIFFYLSLCDSKKFLPSPNSIIPSWFEEFNEFAENRLKEGGNCHRSDIVKSFRRYYAKYRQADSQEYPLTDLEIEKLLRFWNQKKNDGKAEMTSSGFYYGIQINTDADVFVAR